MCYDKAIAAAALGTIHLCLLSLVHPPPIIFGDVDIVTVLDRLCAITLSSLPLPVLVLRNTTSVRTTFHASGSVPCYTISRRTYFVKALIPSSFVCLHFFSHPLLLTPSRTVFHLNLRPSLCTHSLFRESATDPVMTYLRVLALLSPYLLHLSFQLCVLISALLLYWYNFVRASCHRLFDYLTSDRLTLPFDLQSLYIPIINVWIGREK
jgi:hypothetical protein